MAIAPGASQRGKLDRTRSRFVRVTEFPLVTGVPFTEEGQLAKAVNTGGVVHASPSMAIAANTETVHFREVRNFIGMALLGMA